MKYLVFSHFLNRSLQQNNYSLSTVTRWWSFAEELRGTCFLEKTFCVRHQDQLDFAPRWYYKWHELAWQNNFKLENCVWFGRCFLRVLEQVCATNDRGRVKRHNRNYYSFKIFPRFWLAKAHVWFTITSYWWPNLEEIWL